MTEDIREFEPYSKRYLFLGFVFGIGVMAVTFDSLGVSTFVPLLLLLSILALFSTFGVQAGAVKLGSASIGVWLGSVFVFMGAFMLEMFSAIGYCQYSSPIPLEFILC